MFLEEAETALAERGGNGGSFRFYLSNKCVEGARIMCVQDGRITCVQDGGIKCVHNASKGHPGEGEVSVVELHLRSLNRHKYLSKTLKVGLGPEMLAEGVLSFEASSRTTQRVLAARLWAMERFG